MSATPRTDAIEERNGNVLCGSANLEFARTLERELAATERLRFGADADRRRLRAEVERLKTCGITELAAINPSVADYCKHWEARAEKAEAALAAIKGTP